MQNGLRILLRKCLKNLLRNTGSLMLLKIKLRRRGRIYIEPYKKIAKSAPKYQPCIRKNTNPYSWPKVLCYLILYCMVRLSNILDTELAVACLLIPNINSNATVCPNNNLSINKADWLVCKTMLSIHLIWLGPSSNKAIFFQLSLLLPH